MRLYTKWNWLTILLLSLGIYYLFVWVCNYMTTDKTYMTVMELHMSPLFYLIVGVCVALCFIFDLFFDAYYFNFAASPSDYLRNIASLKYSIGDYVN